MITNFLMDHRPLVPALLALFAAACVAVGYLLLRTSRYGRPILWALVAVSLLVIAGLTLVPAGIRMPEVMCTMQFHLPTLRRVELLANVALFFAPALFATLATNRALLTLFGAAFLSALIEAIQANVFSIGRACDSNDWAMNVIGATVAVLLAKVTLKLTNRKPPAPKADTTPTNPAPVEDST